MQQIIKNLLLHYQNLPTQYGYHYAFLIISIFLNYINEISKYVKQMNKSYSLKKPFLAEKLARLTIFLSKK